MSDDFKVVVPTLETTRLLLRPLIVSDASDIFGYASDAAMTRHVFWPRHETIELTHRFIAWLNGPNIHAQALVLPSTGHVIGTIFLHGYHAYRQKAEIAFNLSRGHRAKVLSPRPQASSRTTRSQISAPTGSNRPVC